MNIPREFHILIVEDDARLAANLEDILALEGYAPSIAPHGAAAQDLCRNGSFDLALVDLRLPDISGSELIHLLAEIRPGMEFIMMTGYASLETAIDVARQKSVVGYETKPLNMDRLLFLIRQVMERRVAEKELILRAQLLDAASDSIVLHDEQGNLIYFNEAFCHYRGYPRQEMAAMNLRDLLPSEDRARFDSKVSAIRAAGKMIFEAVDINKDGSLIPVEVHARTLDWGGRRLILSAARDQTEHKLAEEALATFKLGIERSDEAIFMTTPDGVITYVNPAFERVYGFSRAEALGKTPRILKSGTLPAEAYKSFWDTILAKKVIAGEIVNKTKDGRLIVIYNSVNPVLNSQGDIIAFLAIQHDITEQKRSEERQQQNYQEQTILNALLRISLQPIALDAMLDLALAHIMTIPWLATEAKGAIFLAEGEPPVLAMKTQHGLAREVQEICATVQFGCCHCGRAAMAEELQFVPNLDEHHEVTYPGISPHGHYCVPILSAGRLLGVLNLYVDAGHRRDAREEVLLAGIADVLAGMVERKRAEGEIVARSQEIAAMHSVLVSTAQTLELKEVLQEVVTQVGEAMESAYTSIVLVDKDGALGIGSRTFRGIPAIPTIARPLGITAQVVASGEPAFVNDVAEHANTNPALLAAGIRSYAAVPIRRKDSTIGALFVHSTRPKAFAGRRQLLLSFANQTAIVIENARLYEEAAAAGALREANRLKSELLSNVSHELRTPLASIKGYSTSLLRYFDKLADAEKRDFLQEIDRASDALTELVENLLQLSRLEAGGFPLNKEDVDISAVVRKATATMQKKTQKHRLLARLPEAVPIVQADPRRVRQVLDNLLENAIKYSPLGGDIIVTCEVRATELLIAVKDHGIGIQPHELEHLFERFYQASGGLKSKSSGAGLGLAICKHLVEGHGGRIMVESKPGEGSTFSFTLPLPAASRPD